MRNKISILHSLSVHRPPTTRLGDKIFGMERLTVSHNNMGIRNNIPILTIEPQRLVKWGFIDQEGRIIPNPLF